jgi:hypothetical protein
LDGTVFRAPILVEGVTPYIPTWKKPITIARHAYGDVYKNTELKVEKGSKAEAYCDDNVYDYRYWDGSEPTTETEETKTDIWAEP